MKGGYKGGASNVCFACNQVGHWAAQCPSTYGKGQLQQGNIWPLAMAPPPATPPPPIQYGGEGQFWPDGTPKIWCEIHQKDVGHTTAQCWKGGGGKGNGGSSSTAIPLYPRAPGVAPQAYPHIPSLAQQEESQRRITREMIAEAIPARAGQLYRNNCTPGLSVTFTRDATERDVTTLREAFQSMGRGGNWHEQYV